MSEGDCRALRGQGKSGGECRLWGHDGFVLDGGQSAEALLASAVVVGAFDPGDDLDAEAVAGWPAAASLMLSHGVPLKAVQETLGHSTIRLTTDTYGHLMPEDSDRVAQVVDRALGA